MDATSYRTGEEGWRMLKQGFSSSTCSQLHRHIAYRTILLNQEKNADENRNNSIDVMIYDAVFQRVILYNI